MAADACEAIVDLSSARAVAGATQKTALAARAAAAAAAAAYAAAAAAYAADAAAAYAAAAAAADAAAAAADAAADARSKAKIKVLSLAAKIGLEALIKLKSPGCQWLDLCANTIRDQ